MQDRIVIFWFRRDLRLIDNTALNKALLSGYKVLPIFIFDTTILEKLSSKYDRRVDYIHQALEDINQQLSTYNTSLHTFVGNPEQVFNTLVNQYNCEAVYCNKDYEPQAIVRDKNVKNQLALNNIAFYQFKDQVIFEQSEIAKADGSPYTVYTPYANKWRLLLTANHYPIQKLVNQNFVQSGAKAIHTLANIGFQKTDIQFHQPELDISIIKEYDKYRDFPALQHTTQLGIALRFGTISIRKCVHFALVHNAVWLSELIWREFFMQILFHFPQVVHRAFKPQYDFIDWRNNEAEFKLWCDGKTGYPIVDAGMHQLNKTGYMHNRVRMIVASFLCKHLLIDWRWGEAYFAEKLNDYDLSANNGNWQWAAGCGCDAAPYFRVFNPTLQTEKFDKDLKYIKTWNPDYENDLTPPIVPHEMARDRAIRTYKKALNNT